MLSVARTHFQKVTALSQRFLPYWLAAFATAVASFLFSKAFTFSESIAMRWVAIDEHLALVVIPCGLLVCWQIVNRLSPEAGGSGIPQLIAAIKALPDDYGLASRMLNPWMVGVKFFATCLCAAVGGITGREGPMLQISGGIFHFVYRRWPKFQPNLDLRSMILAGGAAGLAAAFNTPLGGIVFAIEELAKVHLSEIRTYILHAVILAGLFSEGLLGNYLYLGRIDAADAGLRSIPEIVVTAVVVGFVGALFCSLLVRLMTFRARQGALTQALLTLVLGLGVAAMFLAVGRSGLGSGRELIVELLHHPDRLQLLPLALVRVFANLFTYGAGVAGGIFAPALASGASLGALMSQYVPGADPQLLVLVGMTAFLTAVTQTPVTSCVLVLEMTDGHRVIFSLMLGALFAQGVAKLVQPESFYEQMSEKIIGRHRD